MLDLASHRILGHWSSHNKKGHYSQFFGTFFEILYFLSFWAPNTRFWLIGVE